MARYGSSSLCLRFFQILLSKFFLDLVNGVLDSGDCACFLIRDFDAENPFELHEELHGIKGVSSEIIGEVGGFSNFRGFDAELVDDDLLYLFYDFLVLHNSKI